MSGSGFEIQFDDAKLREIDDMLSYYGENSNKALCRAINKTLTGAKTDIAKEIYQVLNVTQKRIKKNMKIDRATYAKLSARLHSTGESIPLIDFGFKGLKSGGVSGKVKRNSSKKAIRGAFIARMPNPKEGEQGHLGVFMRRHPSQKYKPSPYLHAGVPIGQPGAEVYYVFPGAWSKERKLPIYELKGTKVEDVFGDAMPAILAKAQERLDKNLDHEVTYLIQQHIESGDGYEEAE